MNPRTRSLVSVCAFTFALIPIVTFAQETTTAFTIPAPTAAQVGPQFSANLSFGSSGTDVVRLQRYLNTHGCPLAMSGPGSYQNETEYFGARTKLALQCFQKDTGLITPTGNLGTLTREYISTLP